MHWLRNSEDDKKTLEVSIAIPMIVFISSLALQPRAFYEITQSHALGAVRLIARKMLYVRCYYLFSFKMDRPED